MPENQLIDFGSIITDLIKASIVGIIQWMINSGFKRLSARYIRLASTLHYWRLFLILAIWLLLNCASLYWKPSLTFLVITSLIVAFFIWKEITSFWSKGVLHVDKTIANGLNVEKALKLCTNQLDFLGIGAAKLTSNQEFDAAIKRCNRPDIPIRFLLTKPENTLLTDAAKRKDENPAVYQKKVEASLRKIADLKKDKKMNIEVRFYPFENPRDMPLLRLMFINNSICLLSYHVFGEGDGTQSPQLHLKRFEDRRDTDSFYYPFSVYFNHLWAGSTAWDFEFPIK